MRRPHVAIICTAHSADDIRMFHRMTCSLASNRWRVSLLAPLVSAPPDFPNGVTHFEIPFKAAYLSRLLNAKKSLPLLRELKPDLVIFPDPELFPIVLRYKRESGATVVFDRHENFEQSGSLASRGPLSSLIAKAYASYEWANAPRLDGIIVVLQEMIENLNPKAKTIVAHNFPTAGVIAKLYGKPRAGTKSYTCVNLGAVHVSRGLFDQLEVARILVNERNRNDFSLLLGGLFDPGSLEQCESFIRSHSLEDNVTLQKSRLAHAEVANYYRAAKIGFSPYLNNAKAKITLQNKILEFMGAGLPVITSPSSANGRIVKAANCGKLLWADEVMEIADTIEHWMDCPSEARNIGARGREYVVANCTWEEDFQKLESWLKSLL